MNTPIKFLAAALLLGIFMFVCVLLLPYLGGNKIASTLVARDSNSPTVVSLNTYKPESGKIYWDCTISADGNRPTQNTGWPPNLIDPSKSPNAIVWHSNPTWIEIIFSSGEKVKLTWDENAIKEARQSNSFNFYLSPKFELMKNE